VIAVAGAVLSRDDGVIPVVALSLAALLGLRTPQQRRMIWVSLIAMVVIKSAHLGWRFAYYGDWVPNTYYLKLGGDGLSTRLTRGLTMWFSVIVRAIWPLPLPALFEFRRRRDLTAGLLFAPFVALSAYSVYVGGDAWEFLNFANRYLVAGLPGLCILAGLYLERIYTGDEPAGRLLLGIGGGLLVGGIWDIREKLALTFFTPPLLFWGVCALGLGLLVIAWSRRVKHAIPGDALTFLLCLGLIVGVSSGRPYVQWALGNAQLLASEREVSALGLAVQDTTAPDATIAVLQAGSTVYFSRRRAVDLLGKNDRHVATMQRRGFYPGHDKTDFPYSLGFRPDLVVTIDEPEDRLLGALQQFGYERLCRAIWIRPDTSLVQRADLAARCT
jgi:hypothetical protein